MKRGTRKPPPEWIVRIRWTRDHWNQHNGSARWNVRLFQSPPHAASFALRLHKSGARVEWCAWAVNPSRTAGPFEDLEPLEEFLERRSRPTPEGGRGGGASFQEPEGGPGTCGAPSDSVRVPESRGDSLGGAPPQTPAPSLNVPPTAADEPVSEEPEREDLAARRARLSPRIFAAEAAAQAKAEAALEGEEEPEGRWSDRKPPKPPLFAY